MQRSFLGEIRTLRPCAACRGFGTIIPDPCRECSGDGRVRVAPHAHRQDPGRRRHRHPRPARRPGRGRPRRRPGRRPLRRDPRRAARRRSPAHGNDLHCTVTVPMTAAALGTTLTLPTLEADVVDDGADSDVETSFELDIKPGTQSGTEQVAARPRRARAARRPRRPRRHRRWSRRRPGSTRARRSCCASSPRSAARSSPTGQVRAGGQGRCSAGSATPSTALTDASDDAAGPPGAVAGRRRRRRRGRGRPATRRTTRSPYAGCAVGEPVVLTDGAGRRSTGRGRRDRQAASSRSTVAVGRRRRRARRRRSSSSRRCPRATAASSPSRCSPRSASTRIVPWAAAR